MSNDANSNGRFVPCNFARQAMAAAEIVFIKLYFCTHSRPFPLPPPLRPALAIFNMKILN